jgi:hypothetical protein
MAGCGSHASAAGGQTVDALVMCLRADGYHVIPESASDIHSAPKEFEFVSVLNASHPGRHARTLTVSRSEQAARRVAAWLQQMTTAIAGESTDFPVEIVGAVAIGWATGTPRAEEERSVRPCAERASVKRHS